jgi:ribonuclease HII
VDEAGRGPLAGPVVAAAVVLAPGRKWEGIDDSKKLAPETREEIFARVLNEARAFSWSVIGSRAIDRSNILRASLEAMRRAVVRLRVPPDLVLVDGHLPVPGIACEQRAIVDGDARLISIAAASVVAKVVRDRIMGPASTACGPGTAFARHKGYATREHLAAIACHGPCPAPPLLLRAGDRAGAAAGLKPGRGRSTHPRALPINRLCSAAPPLDPPPQRERSWERGMFAVRAANRWPRPGSSFRATR